MKKSGIYFFLPLFISGCATLSVEPTAKIDKGLEDELPPYNGPKAKIMVAKFGWDVGTSAKRRVRVRGPWWVNWEMTEEEEGYTEGLRTMLVTTLVQSKRFRVLEREVFDQLVEEAKLSGDTLNIKGADLLIVASVTAWEPGIKKTGGSLGGLLPGKTGVILGALSSAVKKSYMAMDIRIIDAKTSEILAATRVEGIAKEINLGALGASIFGSVPLAGGLSIYSKTPMEKAIRLCIKEAVKYIIENTPKEYFKY